MQNSAQYRIYYEDTDAGGVVYYANYLKFFERARTEFLRQKNLIQSELKSTENLIFVVRKCQIEYKKPARLDDLITIKTTLKEIAGVTIKMYQEMFCGDDLLNILDCEIISVAADSTKPKKIPQTILEKFNV